jgi:hypothetical protein
VGVAGFCGDLLNEAFVLNRVISGCAVIAVVLLVGCGRDVKPAAEVVHYAKTSMDVVVTPAAGPAK